MVRSWLRSRSGTSSARESSRTISRLGCDRPVSRKLRCRVEIPASTDRSSWLNLRRARQRLSSGPKVAAGISFVWARCMRGLYTDRSSGEITFDVIASDTPGRRRSMTMDLAALTQLHKGTLGDLLGIRFVEATKDR